MATTISPEIETGSAAETEAAARQLARHLRSGDLLALVGELGAGKTTFVRGLAGGLGSEAAVMSPTFQLVRVYQGHLQLAHVDLYRLETPSDLAELGLDELLDEGVVVVEWGDRLPGAATATIRFEVVNPQIRRLVLEGGRPGWCW